MTAVTLTAQAKACRAAAEVGMAPGTQKTQRYQGQLEAAPQRCGTGRPGLSDGDREDNRVPRNAEFKSFYI